MRGGVVAVALAAPAVVAAAGLAVTSVAAAVDGTPFVIDTLLLALALLSMATVGALLAIRVPANAVGWLLLVSAFVLGVEFLAQGYAGRSATVAAGSWPGTAVAAWLYSNLFAVPVFVMTVAIPLVYPDGRLLSRRWRWLVAALVWTCVSTIVRAGFRPGLISDTNFENPFGIAGIEPLLSLIDLPSPLGVAAFIGGISSVAIRFRRGGMVQRQQVKWLIAATGMAVIAWTLVAVAGVTGITVMRVVGWYGALLAFIALPVAIGVAILRYRLYEIDRIMSRTIAWSVVTGALVSVFAGGVVVLQAALARFTQGETLAVAVSTLVAAALFQPLRRWVQRVVDRRFDRATYDAQRTVQAFAERLRGEVALDAVAADLRQTVATSIKPKSIGFWLRPSLPRSSGRS
jgi:hypothetical protein